MSDADRAVAMLLQDNAAIFSEVVQLRAENARQREWIREAVRFMGCVTECDAGGWAVWMDELVKKARELGVDA